MTDGSKATTMAPFVDMANHGQPANAEWVFGIHDRNFDRAAPNRGTYDDYASGFILYNPDPIKKGSEVVISYGPKTNEQLLGNYGFMLKDNPVTTGLKYKIAISDKDDIHAALKKDMLKKIHVSVGKLSSADETIVSSFQSITLSVIVRED